MSIEEFSTTIGSASESVDTVTSAISAAKSLGEELATRFAALGANDKNEQTAAVCRRLEEEAAAAASRLKDLLGEIQQQAEALRGLQGTPSGGTTVGVGSSAPPDTAAPSPESSSGPVAPREIGGRTYSIHAQERMADPTRNVSAPEIEQAIATGKHRDGRNPGTIEYYDAEARIHVVTSESGDVVTVRRQSRTPGWAK